MVMTNSTFHARNVFNARNVFTADKGRLRSSSRMYRSMRTCTAEAGKGFGTKTKKQPSGKQQSGKKKKPVTLVDNEQAVKQAVKLAGGGSRSNPVDPKQAARGKIDYAKVKDWGGEQQKDPGSLQMTSFVPGKDIDKQKLPFYARLTMLILQTKDTGLIDDIIYNKLPVSPKDNTPLEKDWVFSKPRYIQYLVDLQSVHHTLESGIAEAMAAQQGSVEDNQILAALDCFSERKGLARSLEIATDLTNLDHSMQDPSHPGPALHIRAFTDRISELSQQADKTDGALRLIAHVFCTHLHHFTGGSKTGASIAQKLNLFKLNAVHLFRTYPLSHEFPDKDPFKAFQEHVNACGRLLDEKQIETIESELPLAFAHVCLLICSIAHSD